MNPTSDAASPVVLSEQELTALLVRAFVGLGVSEANAPAVAAVVTAAERDGALSHGLQRMAGYAASLRTGWVDGAATPRIEQTTPCMLSVDAANGFAQPALAAVRPRAIETARAMGVATVFIRHSHHFAALWPDVESFANAGLVALSVVNTRSHIVVWDGKRKVLGTNPMAFACPRASAPPIVWDQASSMRAQGEVLLARNQGRAVPDGVGVDADGQATTDPARILDGGALLPFGGTKGANIAFAIEILAAAMGGGPFGFEIDPSRHPGAQTSPTSQFLLLQDPARAADFGARIEVLVQALRDAGTSRLPADRRYANRARSRAEGIRIAPQVYQSAHRDGRHQLNSIIRYRPRDTARCRSRADTPSGRGRASGTRRPGSVP